MSYAIGVDLRFPMKFKEKEEQPSEGIPHADYQKNISYFNKINLMVIFDESVRSKKIIPYKGSDIWTGMQYVTGEYGAPLVLNISFSQDSNNFKKEICAIFNHLGYKNLLSRKIPPKMVQEEVTWYNRKG